MFKHNQFENSKPIKKTKDIKLFTNYIPVKKANAHSNISEYETEISINKNFSNKVQKNINYFKAKSVQTSHNNRSSPNRCLTQNNNKKINQRYNKSDRGSLYNLNNLNLNDYFSEKIIMTQQKFIKYKDNKINTLQKELSLLKKEVNLYESKNMENIDNNTKTNKLNGNITTRDKSQSIDKNMNINKNINDGISQFKNDKINKILLENNKSYFAFNTFYNKEVYDNNIKTDKKLMTHLSSLLTENNVENINIKTKYQNQLNNTTKRKNKNKKNKKNENKDKNKKILLNVIYLSKKGCFNRVNNNYEYNTKIVNLNNNISDINNKEKVEEKEIKHELHFFENTMKERKNVIKENLKSKKENIDDTKMSTDLQNLSNKMNNLFNCFFDYYQKHKNL